MTKIWRPKGGIGWLAAMVMAMTLAACGGGEGGTPGPDTGTFTLSVSTTGGGTVTSQAGNIDCGTVCTAAVSSGTSVTLTATPATGQAFQGWGGACAGQVASCSVTMDAARSVSATFVQAAPTTFALNVTVSGSGTVTSQPVGINCGSSCSALFAANAAVVLTATPAAGQVLQSWGGACGSATGNTCTLNVTQATSATATFATAAAAGWSPSATSLSSGGSGEAKVAIDAAGRALAVWLALEPGTLTTGNLVASRFDPGSGWASPTSLEASPRDVTNFDLAMDPASGRAVVLWTQGSDTSTSAAWSRHFDPSGGWTTTQPVQSPGTPTGRADQISVGIDAQGNAVATWSQLDGSRFNIWANRGTATGVWGSAQLLETMDELGRVDGNPRIAVSPQGDASVVWQASGGTVANRGTWTNRYAAGSGWGTASQLVAVSGGSAPDIAIDANGNAVMVWGQLEGVTVTEMYTVIRAKRFQAGSWGSTIQVARELGANSVVSAPRVKMNATGSTLVVWGQGDASVRATVAGPGASWPAPTIVKPVASQAVGSALVSAIDGQGNVMVTWAQGNSQGGADAMLATRSASGAWVAGVVHQAGIWADPFVALNDRGDGHFTWTQFVNTSTGTQVQARRYSSGR